jgi:hypothetical protein
MSRLQSIPFPDGHGPVTQSVDKILIGQGEYNRIARKLDKADAQPGPMRRSKVDILREEYRSGLERGGEGGSAVLRGVLSAIDELGLDPEDVVGEFRSERHRKSLMYAQRTEELLGHLPSRSPVPEPPVKRPSPKSLTESPEPQKRKTNQYDRRTNTILKATDRHW